MKQLFSKRTLTHLDKKMLLYITAFLLAFIPLYPKLPLFDIIPGYIVRVRIEDILILATVIVWIVQVIRKKATLKTPLTWMITAYAVIGFLSVLSSFFITKTVPLHPVHVGKTLLHYLRNLEYLSLFFITFSSIQSKKDVQLFFKVFLATFTGVTLYGIGQKYLYWPVYSTMNREFSKGLRLYLTEHARVQSTFGGHYDLAAYIVLSLPLVLVSALTTSKRHTRWLLWGLFTLGTWLLIVSAARTAFAATLVALVVVICMAALKKEALLKQRLIYITKQGTIVGLLFLALVLKFGDDLSDRMLDALEGYPQLNMAYLNFNETKTHIFYEYLPEKLGLTETMASLEITAPENAISTDELDAALIASDQQPVTNRPSDVYVDVPDIVQVATISATGENIILLVEQPRTYSDNALRYGLSMAIRLDTLWPQAWQGFTTNPLLGTGYATLTKSELYEFTEADSTDNNFLRTLGETGSLGFMAFFGTIALALKQAFNVWKKNKKLTFEGALSVGYIAATIGLLVNALFIDVFVSSKVAFTFWLLTGIVVALAQVSTHSKTRKTTA